MGAEDPHMAFSHPPSPAFCSSVVATSLLLSAAPVVAHGIDAGRYTVEREGVSVRIVGTPRSVDLRAFDDDGDGLLSKGEVRAHRAELRAAVDTGFVVTAGDGSAPVCEPTDVSTPGSGDPRVIEPRADHLRFTRMCRFDHVPTALRVHDRFLARAAEDGALPRLPSLVDAVEVSPPVNGSRALLREVETVALTASAPTATVLAERPAAAAPTAAEGAASRRPSPWAALAIIALAAIPSLVLRRKRRHVAPSAATATSPSPSLEARSS